jgi:hypothetical protein
VHFYPCCITLTNKPALCSRNLGNGMMLTLQISEKVLVQEHSVAETTAIIIKTCKKGFILFCDGDTEYSSLCVVDFCNQLENCLLIIALNVEFLHW